ncbi:hypothetical protein ACFE04_016244 [Oxalis oulophora]
MGNKEYADSCSTIILHTCIAGCLMVAVVASMNYYFREEQEWGLNQNNDRQEMIEHLKERTDLKNINKVILCCYIICNISYVGLLICHIIFALSTATGPEELREAKWQIFPNPFATFLDNEMEFVGLTIGLYMPYPILIIERFSEESTITFENLDEGFAGMDQTRHLQESDYLKLREMEREYLRQKIRSAILDHQRNINNPTRIGSGMSATFGKADEELSACHRQFVDWFVYTAAVEQNVDDIMLLKTFDLNFRVVCQWVWGSRGCGQWLSYLMNCDRFAPTCRLRLTKETADNKVSSPLSLKLVSLLISNIGNLTGIMCGLLYTCAFFPLIQKLKAFFTVAIVSVTWFCVCYTGEKLTELGETLLDKVNNIPWYYLDPPRRKDYYIFVCMAQKPIVITAMGWYQSGMPIYMQGLPVDVPHPTYLCMTYCIVCVSLLEQTIERTERNRENFVTANLNNWNSLTDDTHVHGSVLTQ